MKLDNPVGHTVIQMYNDLWQQLCLFKNTKVFSIVFNTAKSKIFRTDKFCIDDLPEDPPFVYFIDALFATKTLEYVPITTHNSSTTVNCFAAIFGKMEILQATDEFLLEPMDKVVAKDPRFYMQSSLAITYTDNAPKTAPRSFGMYINVKGTEFQHLFPFVPYKRTQHWLKYCNQVADNLANCEIVSFVDPKTHTEVLLLRNTRRIMIGEELVLKCLHCLVHKIYNRGASSQHTPFPLL